VPCYNTAQRFWIPDFGVNGAAISAAVNNIVLNVMMAIAVKEKPESPNPAALQ